MCEDAAAKSQPQQILSVRENVLFQTVFLLHVGKFKVNFFPPHKLP